MTVRERESFSIHHCTADRERVGEGRKKDNRNLSIVSSHPKQPWSPPGSYSFLRCSPAPSYLQGRGVRSILPEAGPRSPRKAQPEALWGQERTALPDPVLHTAPLMVVLHMEPKGDVHRGCCLRTEPLVVAVLLDTPVKRSNCIICVSPICVRSLMQSNTLDCPFPLSRCRINTFALLILHLNTFAVLLTCFLL